MRGLFCFIPFYFFFCTLPLSANELFGVTTDGTLIQIDVENAQVGIRDQSDILKDASSFTFDPAQGRALIGTKYEIYAVSSLEGRIERVVDLLIEDRTPPAGIVIGPGFFEIRSFDISPRTAELFAVVNNLFKTFLVKLDLSLVDENKHLEIDVIGQLADSGMHTGFEVYGIAFDNSGELFGTGINPEGRLHILKIQTSGPPFSLAVPVDESNPIRDVLSIPWGMAHSPESDLFYATGKQEIATGLPVPVFRDILFAFDSEGEHRIVGPLNVEDTVRGLAFVTQFDDEPPRVPEISSIYPRGGNCGSIVRVFGSGFTANRAPNISSVEFGGVAALDPISVVSDSVLQVVVPSGPPGAIRVTTFTDANGDGRPDSAESESVFAKPDLFIIDEEANQGINGHPLIAGKDTLFRLFTGSEPTSDPVTFRSSSLRLTRPDGRSEVVDAQFYTDIVSNAADPDDLRTSERANINFYVSGDLLDQAGLYTLEYTVRGDQRCEGRDALFSYSSEAKFEPAPDDLRILVVWGGVFDEGERLLPREEVMMALPKVMEEFSRAYPVRNGISRLGQDMAAGVRFDVAPVWIELGKEGPGKVDLRASGFLGFNSLFWQIKRTIVPVLESYNKENPSDPARFAAVLFDVDIRKVETPAGIAEYPGRISASSLLGINGTSMTPFTAVVPLHEIGHNLGLVKEDSPNLLRTPEGSHSKNIISFPPNGDPRKVRAFDVPGQKAVRNDDGASILPLSIMSGPIAAPSFFNFFELREYQDVIKALGHAPSVSKRTFTLVAAIGLDDSVEILQSYESTEAKTLTEVDEESPYELLFFGKAGEILAREPFSVSFLEQADDGEISNASSALALVVRPVPEGTTAVQLNNAQRPLVNINRSLTPPSVELIAPAGGETLTADDELTIEWSASDPDTPSEELRYDVSYSPDGQRWLPIAGGLSETSTVWSTALAPGSSSGQIRVTVTDGFNSTSVLSQSFSVESKQPTVTILQPTNEQAFLEFDTIVLEGFAFDLEKGVLADPALEWFLETGELLGTGRKTVLPPGRLGRGEYRITLVADDGEMSTTTGTSIIILSDTDRDGLSNIFENSYEFQDPEDPFDSNTDWDSDGLSSFQEAFFGSDPERFDSDGDGLSDGEEVATGRDPGFQTGDFDRDGDVDRNDIMELLTERNYETAPGSPRDLDGDGIITVMDARKLTLLCTRPRCAVE